MTKSATCTEAGVRTCTCKLDATHTRTEPIAAPGHADDGGKVTKAATVYATGKKTHTCTRCKKVLKTEAIPKVKSFSAVFKGGGGKLPPAKKAAVTVYKKGATAYRQAIATGNRRRSQPTSSPVRDTSSSAGGRRRESSSWTRRR